MCTVPHSTSSALPHLCALVDRVADAICTRVGQVHEDRILGDLRRDVLDRHRRDALHLLAANVCKLVTQNFRQSSQDSEDVNSVAGLPLKRRPWRGCVPLLARVYC